MKQKDNRLGEDTHISKTESEQVISRRAALRRFGFTSLATFAGVLGVDDLARIAISHMKSQGFNDTLTKGIAKELRGAGIAFAQGTGNVSYKCGVHIVPCTVCAMEPETGQYVQPCPCQPNSSACLNCSHFGSDTCDDQDIQDIKFCNCQQSLINRYPGCADCTGYPTGDPACVAFNTGIADCRTRYANGTL